MNLVNQSSFSFTELPVSAIKTYDDLVAAYSSFVDAIVRKNLAAYKLYCQGGGKESFFKQCWWLMMNETVEEAERILQHYIRQNNDGEKLSKALQKIAEDRLLNVNELAL